MNAKKKTIIIAVIAILVVAFIAVAFLATQKSADYYTQIDNDCVTEIAPHGAMNYRYTLSAYDETGAEKELNFETSRKKQKKKQKSHKKNLLMPEGSPIPWCCYLGRSAI